MRGSLNKRGDLFDALEPERIGRHRDPQVLRGDRDGRGGIASLVRVDEALEERLFLSGRCCGRPFRAPRRQVLFHRRSRPLDSAVRGGDARLEKRGCLARRPAEDVAHDERGTLRRRQQLHRCEKGELDRLAFDCNGIWLVVGRRHLIEQAVGIGLEPWHLGERLHLRHLARAAPEHVEADVRGDAEEPSTKQVGALEAVPAPPSAQEGLLHRVIRIVERGQHPVAMHVQLSPVALGERRESGFVSRDRRAHEAVDRHERPGPPRSCRTHVLPSGSLKCANEL